MLTIGGMSVRRINEAVDIAKEFSTEESRRFVNGILDSYMSELGRDPRKAEGG